MHLFSPKVDVGAYPQTLAINAAFAFVAGRCDIIIMIIIFENPLAIKSERRFTCHLLVS